MRYSFYDIYGNQATGISDTNDLKAAIRTATNFEVEIFDNYYSMFAYQFIDGRLRFNHDWLREED